MDEELKKVFPGELLELLANVAFVGIERGHFKEAQEIFAALVEARPHNINSKIAKDIRTNQSYAHKLRIFIFIHIKC